MKSITLTIMGLLLLVATAAFAAPAKNSAKDAPAASSKTVDSGSFGVFQGTNRIATETFTVTQSSSGSVVTSEFKMEKAAGDADQTSKLELTPSGEIIRYEWKEHSPGSADAYVAPSNDFLTEHFRDDPQAKEQQKPFLLPASTTILDDYFFVQREILVWRYLATSCKNQSTGLQCPLKQPVKFGTLNPHSRLSVGADLIFLGADDITIRGEQKKLSKIELKADNGSWFLWLDQNFKLQQIEDEASGTEIIRD